jgi:hypothetical protein
MERVHLRFNRIGKFDDTANTASGVQEQQHVCYALSVKAIVLRHDGTTP